MLTLRNSQDQLLTYNVSGQSLYWSCPEGRPSSITSATIYKSEVGDDGISEGAVDNTSIDASTTTFDALSGNGQSDPRLCRLAATATAQIGWKYLCKSPSGLSETVEVLEIDTGVSITARHGLRSEYAVGSTFESVVISALILDAWLQDENNISDDLDPNQGYRIRWVYVVDGKTKVWDDYFSLVRYRSKHSVGPHDIDVCMPGWIDDLPIDHIPNRGISLIDHAYEEVVGDLHLSGVPAEMMRNRAVVDRLTISKAILKREESRVVSTGELTPGYEIAKERYHTQLEGYVKTTLTTQISVDTSGAAVKADPIKIWSQ